MWKTRAEKELFVTKHEDATDSMRVVLREERKEARGKCEQDCEII